MAFWGFGVPLTNAYKVYLKVCEEENVEPRCKEHCQFRREVAVCWINPEKVREESKKRSASMAFASPSSVSTITTCVSVDAAKSFASGSSRIADKSLSPTGSLSCRLNKELDHMPNSNFKRKRCALHFWAGSGTTTAETVHCATCNVDSCIDQWPE